MVKLGGRRDLVLIAGLALSVIVVFARPVRHILDVAQEVERSSGLALIPGLIILSVVFLFHMQGKRQEAKVQAQAAAADARQAEGRAIEMERLVLFGQALGRSLDVDAIRDIVGQHLTRLTGSDEAWVMTRSDGRWQALVGTARHARRDLERTHQHIADVVLEQAGRVDGADPIAVHGHMGVPMSAGGNLVGVLGVPDAAGPFTESRLRVLAAAATLLAISLRNAQLFREVRDNSLRDGLTGCVNRTHGLETIDVELRRARRSRAPVSLIMFDIDHFKDINDRYGHLCGDAVLVAVGARIRETLRVSDLKCRYGGEEFLALLPETPLDGAIQVADSLRRDLEEMEIEWKGGTIRVTASFGVSDALPSESDVHAFVARADAALYRAKEQGRNCVRVGSAVAVA